MIASHVFCASSLQVTWPDMLRLFQDSITMTSVNADFSDPLIRGSDESRISIGNLERTCCTGEKATGWRYFFSCCLHVRNLCSSWPSKLLEEEITFNKQSIFGFHTVVVRRIWMNHLSRSSLFQEGTPYIADKLCVICWGSLTNGSSSSWELSVPQVVSYLGMRASPPKMLAGHQGHSSCS